MIENDDQQVSGAGFVAGFSEGYLPEVKLHCHSHHKEWEGIPGIGKNRTVEGFDGSANRGSRSQP